MGSWLSEREQRLVAGAEAASAATPVPTQIVSNGEYLPPSQSATQKKVEARIKELADINGKRLGLDRRQFMRTSCGMAAAFLAMNEIYGNVFQVTAAEAREPEMMLARTKSLAGQFVFDVQTPSGAKAGKAYISCTTATASVSLCHAAYVLKGGQIDVQVAIPDTRARYTLAVTGGTGIYAGVTGQVRSVETGAGTADRTFHLIRPGQH